MLTSGDCELTSPRLTAFCKPSPSLPGRRRSPPSSATGSALASAALSPSYLHPREVKVQQDMEGWYRLLLQRRDSISRRPATLRAQLTDVSTTPLLSFNSVLTLSRP